MVHFRFGRIWLPDTCESAFRDSILMCICKSRFTQSNFWSQLLLTFKEICHTNQDFYELRQCQKNNWIEKWIV